MFIGTPCTYSRVKIVLCLIIHLEKVLDYSLSYYPPRAGFRLFSVFLSTQRRVSIILCLIIYLKQGLDCSLSYYPPRAGFLFYFKTLFRFLYCFLSGRPFFIRKINYYLGVFRCCLGVMVPESPGIFPYVEQGSWFQNLSVYSPMWSSVHSSRISQSIL